MNTIDTAPMTRRTLGPGGAPRWILRRLGAVGVLVAGLWGAAPAIAGAWEPPASEASKPGEQDTIIFRDGKVLKGTVVEETESIVRFKGMVAGIAAETEYKKTDILEVRRGKTDPADPKKVQPKPDVKPDAKKTPEKTAEKPKDATADGETPQKVYFMELTGEFGRDISQTPIRQAAEDAKKLGVDYLVVIMDNDWAIHQGEFKQELGDDAADSDELFRAEDMDPIFSSEIPRWTKPPKIVFWVKKAMGGAAFLPFVGHDIYFSPEARMGGVGNLTRLFNFGDEVVKQKQYSLRLGHAEGMAEQGGYSYKIVRAMAVPEYVLSYTIEGGQVKYLERLPENPSEFLLTDDAKDTNQDTTKAVVSGEGNDVLTLNAKLAKDLGVSKGTVSTEDDLLFELGISRSVERVNGRSKSILEAWKRNVDDAERDIKRLLTEMQQVNPGGTYEERTKARGIRKGICQKVIGLIDRYGEALARYKGLKPQLLDQIKSIENEQVQDAQAQRKKR